MRVRRMTDEQRAAIYGEKKQLKGTKVGEVVQQAVETFADKKRFGILLARTAEEGVLPAQGIQRYYPVPEGVDILKIIAREMGINMNFHTLGDLAGGEITLQDLTSKKEFWTKNAVLTIVSAMLDQRFYDAFLGDANCFTRPDVPSVRENPIAWTDAKADVMRQAAALIEQTRELNAVGTITQDEPFIGYKDRMMENKIGIDSGWKINDVIAEVNPVAPGEKPRGIYLDNTTTDEDYEAVAEGDPGPLAVFKEDKEVTDVAQYRVGVIATDQTLAKMIRIAMINQGVVNIGRRFGRRLKVDAANLIASKKLTTNDPVTGLSRTITTTDTMFSAKVVDELVDSYQTDMVNRCIGKSKPLTELRRNSDVNFVSNNPHYIAPSTRFSDIGGSDENIRNCKIDSSALDNTFTDNNGFTFDVSSTLVLNVSPSLEMDVEVRDMAVGVAMRWLRTALSLYIFEPGQNSIREVSHA